MYYFTADEHYGHKNIVKYCKRPFKTVEEMDAELIKRNNQVVGLNDTVIHAGDFTLKNEKIARDYIKQLNGYHVFLCGSHDKWMGSFGHHERWEKRIEGQYIVVSHYAMRVWGESHYGSWQLYGHSHSNLKPEGLQYDIGVDNNNFYPVSFEQLKNIFAKYNRFSDDVYQHGSRYSLIKKSNLISGEDIL